MKERFQILSLDGGGLKGIFTASFLNAIEKNTNTNICNHFDLITGTSTGGIIAIALGLGFSSKQILDFYISEGTNIFPAQETLNRIIYGIKHIFIRKYSETDLEEALKLFFGNHLIGESKKRLIIPAFNSACGDVYIYKTAHHKDLKVDYKEPAWKVARATSAAPTFFSSFVNDGGIRLIDGGIWANNPCMVAISEALGYLKCKQENIALLSIGTTQNLISSSRIHVNGGLLPWSTKSIEFLMHGQVISAEKQAYHILGDKNFLRINPTVSNHYTIDKLSEDLVGLGEIEARKYTAFINNMFLKHRASRFIPLHKINKGK